MEALSNPSFWIAVGQIILIDILLGGDNAVVIALACRKLPPRQRRIGRECRQQIGGLALQGPVKPQRITCQAKHQHRAAPITNGHGQSARHKVGRLAIPKKPHLMQHRADERKKHGNFEKNAGIQARQRRV